MSDHTLPENPAHWPSNPYDLLGVRHGANRNELRRAYTRLLKLYKPERAPEEFRRLREAYEQATSWLPWNEEPEPRPPVVNVEPQPSATAHPQHGDAPQPAPDDAAVESVSQPESETQPASEPAQAAPRSVTVSFEQQADTYWNIWLDRPAEAYRALAQLVERQPHSTDLYARLYWILSLQPQLDADRTPCDWLARGLRHCDWPGTLHALYWGEIDRDPVEAISNRYTELLLSMEQVDRLVDMAQRRWRAAALTKWSLIGADLESLRPRLERESASTWLQLLLMAVDELAWIDELDATQTFDKYAGEINRLGAVRVTDFDKLARFDILRELAAGFRRAAGNPLVPQALLTLSALSWTHPHWEIRPEIVAWLEEVFAKPQFVLDNFDRLAEGGAMLLAQLQGFLAPLDQSQDLWTTALRAGHIVDFIDRAEWSNYRKFRPALWSFCRRDFISPEQVAMATFQHSRFQLNTGTHLAEAIESDWPLRCACQASRAIESPG